MAYLGNTPAARFSGMKYQDLTGVTGSPVKRGFTLNDAVGSENEIEVFVNNVRQEPSVAYTVSGTTLTMTGDVETTDDFYVVFQGLAQQTVSHPSGNALQATTGTFTGDVTTTGDFNPTGKEYFRADLTSSQTGIADGAEATVDFNGSGAVAHDTKSKFDATNNAYEFASNGGVYLISFGCCISSDAINTERVKDAGAQVEVATDGSTFAGLFGAYFRPMIGSVDGSNTEGQGSVHLTGTYIYKTTTATTKIRLRTKADLHDPETYEIRTGDNNMQALTFTATNGRGTYMNVARIA